MPIEVRELLIQAKMKEEGGSKPGSLNDESLMEQFDERQQQMLRSYKDQIIRECMAKVEKLLHQQKDR